MGFFIDKRNRRKSPIALAAFGAAVLNLIVFGVLYALLAEPLYHAVSLGGATTAVHSVIIAVIGTAVCCLEFLAPDKRMAPYGFAGLAVVLLMFYAACFSLSEEVRGGMVQMITAYGLAPVLIGNAVSWPVYLKMKRDNPAMNQRKTIQEELREAVAKEQKKAGAKPAVEPKPVAPVTEAPETEIPAEEAMFGPEAGRGSATFRSAQEEAMLLYEDEDSDD